MKIKNLKFWAAAAITVTMGMSLIGCEQEKMEDADTSVVDLLNENEAVLLLDEHLKMEQVSVYDANGKNQINAFEALEKMEDALKLYRAIDEIDGNSIINHSLYKKAKKDFEVGIFTYKVCSGDTLSEIAEKTGTTVEQLMKDNNLKDDNIIIGETLLIMGDSQMNFMSLSDVELLGEIISSKKSTIREKKLAREKLLLQKLAIEKWLEENADELMESISLTTIKSAVVEVYDYDVEKIKDVRITSLNSEGRDVVIYNGDDVIIDVDFEKGEQLQKLQNYVYDYQDNSGKNEISSKKIDSYEKNIELIKDVLLSDKSVEKDLYTDIIKIK